MAWIQVSVLAVKIRGFEEITGYVSISRIFFKRSKLYLYIVLWSSRIPRIKQIRNGKRSRY